MLPHLDDLKGEVVRGFSEVWIPRVVRDEGLRRNMVTAPLAVNPGFGFRMTNLRPFDVPAAIPAVSVGLLCIPPSPPRALAFSDGILKWGGDSADGII